MAMLNNQMVIIHSCSQSQSGVLPWSHFVFFRLNADTFGEDLRQRDERPMAIPCWWLHRWFIFIPKMMIPVKSFIFGTGVPSASKTNEFSIYDLIKTNQTAMKPALTPKKT